MCDTAFLRRCACLAGTASTGIYGINVAEYGLDLPGG